MSDRPRVALPTKGLFPHTIGGIERHTHFLASSLTAAGADVTVLTPESQVDGATPYRVEALGVRPARPYLLHTWRLSQAVDARLARGDFDWVYAQDLTGYHYARRVGRKPLLWNPHGLELWRPPGRYPALRALPYAHRFQRLADRCDRAISLGGKLDRIFLESLSVEPERLAVLPNGIDPSWIEDGVPQGAERDPFHLLFIGRLHANKGVDLLLSAIRQLADPRLRLTLVGSGPLKDSLEASAPEGVRFAGRVSDEELCQLLGTCGGLVFTSLYEGMPTVILEAMVAGLPVMATDIGAVATMIEDGRTGVLIEPGSVRAIVDGVRKLLALEGSARATCIERGRHHVLDRFTWQAVARRTLELGASLC